MPTSQVDPGRDRRRRNQTKNLQRHYVLFRWKKSAALVFGV
jgi:hypothetical protein